MKIKTYTQYIKEDIDNIWKNGISKTDNEIAGKVSAYISKIEKIENIKEVINIFEQFTNEIITTTSNKIKTTIPIQNIEDSEKIKKIGKEVYSVISSYYILLYKLSKKFEDVYSPTNIFKDATSPTKDILCVDETTFEKNIEMNIIKLLNIWGKNVGLSSEGMDKISKFKIFESEVNIEIQKISESAIQLLNYIKTFASNKINILTK